MKNIETIEVIELSQSECIDINAKGWVIILGAVIAYIADDWADFKQGLMDGLESLERN